MIHNAYCKLCKKDVGISEIVFRTDESRIYIMLTCGHVCKIVLGFPMIVAKLEEFELDWVKVEA